MTNNTFSKKLVKEGDFFQFYEAPGAKTLVVVFSSRNDRPPNFTFYKTFQKHYCHVIYCNSPVPTWYRDGIPGIPGGLRGVVRQIEDFAKSVNTMSILTVGASMGAYGAALYGYFLNADHCLLMSLEPLLGVPGGKTEITRNKYQWIYPDLTQLKFPPSTLIYGGLNSNDSLGAWLLHKQNNVNCFCMPFAQHDAAEYLSRLDMLDNVICMFIAGESIRLPMYEGGSHLNDNASLLLWELNSSIAANDWATMHAILNENKDIASQSLILRYFSGVSLYRLNKFTEAKKEMKQLIPDIPLSWEIWSSMAALNQRTGQLDGAVQCLEMALKLRPTRSILQLQASKIFEQCGNWQKAFEHALLACQLNYARPEYIAHLKSLSEKLNIPLTETISIWKKNHNENNRIIENRFANLKEMSSLTKEKLLSLSDEI